MIVVVVVLLLFIIYTINFPVVQPRSCRVIYYFDTPTLGRRHQLFGRVTYLSCNQVLYVLRKKKTSHQIRKIIIKKNVQILLTTNFSAWLSTSCCTFFCLSSFHIGVSTKSSISLRSHLSTATYKRKLLLVKHFHIIQKF